MTQVRGERDEMVLVLTDIKRTKRHNHTEYILVEDLVVQACVRWARRHRRVGRLLRMSPTTFRAFCRQLMTNLGLCHHVVTPYCIQRGGATYDNIVSGSFDRALVRGRRQSVGTARLYVRQGEELLAKLGLTPAHNHCFEELSAVSRAFNLQAHIATARGG